MKKSTIVILCFFGLSGLYAQNSTKTTTVDTAYTVKERGANHRVWQRTTYEQGPNGKTVPHIHTYTELATGMHYKNPQTGQWVESRELIESFPGGAVARQGQQQVIFANNLNSYGAIDVQTPDGKRLRSNILGLGYYDSSTGKSILIAELQDSQGELITKNQVLYPNAFKGLKADVRYTYKKASFEQDVILREQPPTPATFGFNPDTTELEVMTEFIDPPQAVIKKVQWNKTGDLNNEVSWGAIRLGRGRVFDLGDANNIQSKASVRKQYLSVDGRNILLENVALKKVAAEIKRLPLQATIKSKQPFIIADTRRLPKVPMHQATIKPIKLAVVAPSDNGFILDYILINADQDDITFQGDMTYLISGTVNIGGTAAFEGGTIIKYGVDTDNPSIIQFWGNLVCNTTAYHPAVFTSQNDDSVGENLNVGGPINYFQAIADGDENVIEIHDVRIAYADYGVHSFHVNISNSQFVNCQNPLYHEWGDCKLNNVLMVNVGKAFNGTEYNVEGCQVTISGCSEDILSADWGGSGLSTVNLTNCILSNVGADGAAIITTNYTVRLTGGSSNLFQVVGGGNCYLVTNSVYRNAGTTNIAPALLSMLRKKTTYPPVVYSNTTISVATTFSPQVQRDTDAPDLGYHYDPDWAPVN